MGTIVGRQYPLSIQAKLPLTSSSQSRGQFKPPKRSRPREETDGSMDDEQLRSLYDVCLNLTACTNAPEIIFASSPKDVSYFIIYNFCFFTCSVGNHQRWSLVVVVVLQQQLMVG